MSATEWAEIREQARYHWLSILTGLGIKVRNDGRHSPCPVCGGKDRFRFDDRDGLGTWYCNQCEPHWGDGFTLVMKVRSCDFSEACRLVGKIIGVRPSNGYRDTNAASDARAVRAILDNSITDTGIIAAYFRNRGLSGKVPATLRLHEALEYWDDSSSSRIYPAMVAPIISSDGSLLGVHLTYIDAVSASKAKVPSPKKMRKCASTITGGAVHLGEAQTDLPLILAEGIETGLAVFEATSWPTWPCLSAHGLKAVQIPTMCKKVYLAADLNSNGTGQDAAEQKAVDLSQAGHEVYLCAPPGPLSDRKQQDWLDVLNEQGTEVVRAAFAAVQPWARDDSTPRENANSAMITKLAKLSPIQYDQQRTQAAKELGVRTETLDREVEKARGKPEKEEHGEAVLFQDEGLPEWPEPVDGAVLIKALTALFTQYLVLPEHGALTLALWVLHSYAHDACDISPILCIKSPDKRCGKTTLLSLLQGVVRRPLSACNITPAALFRATEKWHPTLLVDEADTFLRDSDDLRGILNSGHHRANAYVIRTVGDSHEPRLFRTWAPKAIALIGELSPTLADRAIDLPMRRKRPDEQVTRFRCDQLPQFSDLARQCARWVYDHIDVIADANPLVPEKLHDRAADNWRPLLALAETIGGDWASRVRDAAIALSTDGKGEEAAGVMLLEDIRQLFTSREVDRLSSAEMAEALGQLEERPWPEWKQGKPITPRQIAHLLKPFGVSPKTIRFRCQPLAKGYELQWFEDTFSRYLPISSVTALQHNIHASSDDSRSVTSGDSVTDENTQKSSILKDCYAVTDQQGEISWEVDLAD